MEKYIYIWVVVFFVVIIPAALYLVLKPMLQHNKLLNGVVNYDTFMRKFVFRVELTKEELYAQLKMHNINDSLEYYLNDDYSVITFTRYNAKFPYKILIDECSGYIILKVEQIPLIMNKGIVPYCINDFFVKKFNAKPLQYGKYAF